MAQVGLYGCQIDMDKQGTCTITFSVENSAGLSSSVSRKLVIVSDKDQSEGTPALASNSFE